MDVLKRRERGSVSEELVTTGVEKWYPFPLAHINRPIGYGADVVRGGHRIYDANVGASGKKAARSGVDVGRASTVDYDGRVDRELSVT